MAEETRRKRKSSKQSDGDAPVDIASTPVYEKKLNRLIKQIFTGLPLEPQIVTTTSRMTEALLQKAAKHGLLESIEFAFQRFTTTTFRLAGAEYLKGCDQILIRILTASMKYAIIYNYRNTNKGYVMHGDVEKVVELAESWMDGDVPIPDEENEYVIPTEEEYTYFLSALESSNGVNCAQMNMKMMGAKNETEYITKNLNIVLGYFPAWKTMDKNLRSEIVDRITGFLAFLYRRLYILYLMNGTINATDYSMTYVLNAKTIEDEPYRYFVTVYFHGPERYIITKQSTLAGVKTETLEYKTCRELEVAINAITKLSASKDSLVRVPLPSEDDDDDYDD